MQLTKFTHSCVRLDDGEHAIVLDPGVFSEVDDALDGAEAVLVTHEHPDHVDAARVTAALDRDSRLRLYAPESVTSSFGERGGQVVTVAAGESFDVGVFPVRSFGGQHAVIHGAIPVVANVAFLVGDGPGTVYHPGDSFTVPDAEVGTALLPLNAPWSKVGELIDFAIAVRARAGHPIHDGLVNDRWFGVVEGHVGRLAGPFGLAYGHLSARDTVTV